LDALDGRYVTAEDVGVTVEDMISIAKSTSFVTGIGDRGLGFGGDPAPYTAFGVLSGLEATAHYAFGRTDLEGLRVAVQGIGNVGSLLCQYLHDRGAKLIVADINQAGLEKAADLYGAAIAGLDDILLSDVDIIAPCALGHAITEDIAARMGAKAIAGAANNQLASNKAGQILFDRDIAYAPDYAINAGGIIMAGAEYLSYSNDAEIRRKVRGIYDTTSEILKASEMSGRPSNQIADTMAEDIFLRSKVDPV
jgi:leucine dehydrogenase